MGRKKGTFEIICKVRNNEYMNLKKKKEMKRKWWKEMMRKNKQKWEGKWEKKI